MRILRNVIGCILTVLMLAKATPLIRDFDGEFPPDFANVFQGTGALDGGARNFGKCDMLPRRDCPQQSSAHCDYGKQNYADFSNYNEDCNMPAEATGLSDFGRSMLPKNNNYHIQDETSCYSTPYDIPDTAFPVTKTSACSSLANDFGLKPKCYDSTDALINPQNMLPVEAQNAGVSPDALDECQALKSDCYAQQASEDDLTMPSILPDLKQCPLPARRLPFELARPESAPDDFDLAWAEACKRKFNPPSGQCSADQPMSLVAGVGRRPNEIGKKLPWNWEPVDLSQVENELRRSQNAR